MFLTEKNGSMQNPAAEMSRQIPGTWGQCSEKQRQRWEARDLRDGKEPDYWGLHCHFKDCGLYFTFSKINNISLKFFKPGECLMISIFKYLVALERLYCRGKDKI